MERETQSPAPGTIGDNRFFLFYSIGLLAIVLIGFAPSLFLRVAFDPPPLPIYLHVHGAILTGWFIWLIAQAWLIHSRNKALHRKLGYFAAAYGLIVIAGGLMATFNAVARDLSLGITLETDMADIDPALGSGITYLTFISGVVWANITSVITFGVLLGFAVVLRNRPDTHKRLVLVATASIMGPALARISRYEFLGGEQGPFIGIALLTLLATIAAHDLLTLRKVHRASLAAILFSLALGLLGSKIAGSEFGLEFVRNLAWSMPVPDRTQTLADPLLTFCC